MPEKSTKVQPYRVDYVCDHCGGTMEQTGTVYPTFPPLHEHKCNYCGVTVPLRKAYPRIEHREE